MKQPYVAPEYEKEAFNCPFCNAYANFKWINLLNNSHYYAYIWKSTCMHCEKYIIWYDKKIVFPKTSPAEMPNDDLSEDIKKDYIEAMNVVNDSPRSACALLRLAIQKLCKELGEKGDNINDDIGNLVKKGLSLQIQKSLDIVRVVGNNAVHPGKMNIDDSLEIALSMFKLVNFIAEKMITEPKELNKLYSGLPENALNGITIRDNKAEKK